MVFQLKIGNYGIGVPVSSVPEGVRDSAETVLWVGGGQNVLVCSMGGCVCPEAPAGGCHDGSGDLLMMLKYHR